MSGKPFLSKLYGRLYLLITGQSKDGKIQLRTLKTTPWFYWVVGGTYVFLIASVIDFFGHRFISRHYDERIIQRKRREGLFLLSILKHDENTGLYIPPMDEKYVDVERWPTHFEHTYTKLQRKQMFEEYLKAKEALKK
ncbi:hypothetical protein FDP41_002113 [Naegleria fowleri]|uniref:Uncharacterized protein n=1 Tax=Naegleria fowleri TaxID=5763 RepID=A0A6A5BLY7_NAEFO|nr:uncharacterized protein FDP41_002113 [Naegleria fowleri]KAF0979043.1 hypothetical protein FDP41_002113 [Naegleria fowleri]CAG4711539.1 unnamed protein product [Naegleria fowleri]